MTIVADTGAIIALIDADDRHHDALRAAYEQAPERWLLPWAILPEVDDLLATRVGRAAEEAFLADLADGVFALASHDAVDLVRARKLCVRHRDSRLGLVDALVIAVAERVAAEAIATLDVRHFAAVAIGGAPRLIPRDL